MKASYESGHHWVELQPIVASYRQTVSLLESPARSHAPLLPYLTPNTIYHYRVISKDR
jgi:hypothetical protein